MPPAIPARFKTEPIRCVIDTANDAAEISLDENVNREDLHPADEFERFRELSENRGWGAEEIAARFGTSAHLVKQRLRLGAVSPKLIQVYRDGGLTMDQLQAFAITDDHARQEHVFENLSHNKEPWIIRRDLTACNVAASDRRAVFIGPEAYKEAGGYIIRDLFTEDRGGFYEDAALLDRLVLEKLERIAAEVQEAEGWKWVSAHIDWPHAHGMRRTYPREVELTEEDIAAHDAAANERSCVVLPLFHVNGQYVGVIPALTAGGTVVLLQSFSARRFWSQVRRHRCTFLSIVPMILRTMLAQPPEAEDDKHDVRVSFYALPTSDEEWTAFETRFNVKLIEGYGLSETLGISTSNPVVHGSTKRHCLGLPILGREMRVVDEDWNELPAGSSGAIIIRGEPMFTGYFRNEEATRACMRDGWFSTGDNGWFDEEGYLHFLDRSKDVIKRSGENIAASEVERVLNEHPAVSESAVIGVFDPLRDEAVKAYVVLRAGKAASVEELQAWCGDRLAKFKVPSFLEYRDELPKTSIGKIMKYQLRAEHAALAGA